MKNNILDFCDKRDKWTMKLNNEWKSPFELMAVSVVSAKTNRFVYDIFSRCKNLVKTASIYIFFFNWLWCCITRKQNCC